MEIGDQMEDNFLNDRMKILKEIEHLRKEMNEVGLRCGLNHPDVILMSKRLDGLLNRYNKYYYSKHSNTRQNNFILEITAEYNLILSH